MSSTVTTSTISTLTAAASFTELAATFSLIAIVCLAGLLLLKEVSSAGQGLMLRRFARGLDIATVPMLIAFVAILVLNSGG